MNKIFIFLFFILITNNRLANAQITFQHSYTGAAEVADLENSGYKYYVTDYANNSITIYNDDHSFWKTIMLNVSQNQYLYDIDFVSSKVFNTDDLIELLQVNYQYVSTSDTSGYYIYSTQVVDENGLVLLSVPGGAYSFTYTNVNNEQKLLVYVYDFSVSSYISSTEVYGLPSKYNGVKDILLNKGLPYPNPSKTDIIIPFPNNNSLVRDLIITDTKGVEYRRLTVDKGEGRLNVDTSELPSGNYLYYLRANGKSLPAGKFVVIK